MIVPYDMLISSKTTDRISHDNFTDGKGNQTQSNEMAGYSEVIPKFEMKVVILGILAVLILGMSCTLIDLFLLLLISRIDPSRLHKGSK